MSLVLLVVVISEMACCKSCSGLQVYSYWYLAYDLSSDSRVACDIQPGRPDNEAGHYSHHFGWFHQSVGLTGNVSSQCQVLLMMDVMMYFD